VYGKVVVPKRLLETRSGSSDNTQEIELKELLPALEKEMLTDMDKLFKETGQAYFRAVTLTYRNVRGRAFEK
jgi:hypothetical protein